MLNSADDDRQYRRGVVLGFTMAEILLLLIFLLMLLLAGKLLEEKKAREVLVSERDAAVKEVSQLKPIVEALKQASNQGYDITKDYVRVKQALDAANAQVEKSRQAMELLEEIKKENPKISDEEASDRLKEQFELGKATQQQLADFDPGNAPDDAFRKLIKQAAIGKEVIKTGKEPEDLLANAAMCSSQLQSCKGQVSNLSRSLGGTLPSCWIDESGKSQYIFDARLQSDGIYLSDNKVPGHEADQAALPISDLRFGSPYEGGAIISDGAKLLAWSNAHGCRFYIRVYDRTGVSEKDRYKELMDGVGKVFYLFPQKG